ncbi:MAG: 50S ribosomal protein L13 [Candidatus Micrarchaeia archaeon]
MVKIIDGDGLIVGRVATYVAHTALSGEEVHILNAEKMVMSGDRNYIVQKYVDRRSVKDRANPEHSPKWPKRPDLLVKRIIRGMLPYDKPKGKMAYKKIRVYIGSEDNLKGEKVKFNDSFRKDKLDKYITIMELCEALAYKTR